MRNYIALLRGINIGNRNKILMADLRVLLEQLGFIDIKTYIQTGNIAFNYSGTENIPALSEKIERKITEVYNYTIPVLVISKDEITNIITENTFIKRGINDIERLHITFLETEPKAEELAKITEYKDISGDDEFQVVGKRVYIYCSGTYMDTKFGNNFFEKKLKVKTSTRNWKTTIKLFELTQQ